MKIVMALHPVPNGVQHHRMLTPSVMLANTEGFEVQHVPDLNMCPMPTAMWADVIIVSRLITEFPEKQAKILESLKSTRAKLVVDLDDHWILPSGHPYAQLWKDNRTAHCIRETLKRADLVWTTNDTLKTAIENMVKAPVHIVPNGISPYDTQWAELGEKRPYSELMIGVSAAPNHYPDMRRLKPALQKLRAQRGWRILAMGVHPSQQEKVKAILGTDRIVFEQPRDSWDYADMYSNVDLMVAPLEHNRFNCYRSDLKLAEAAHSRTPILVENYGPYRNHICSVNTWDKLVQVVTQYLTTDPHVLGKYRVNNLDDHSTMAADRTRVETLKALVQAPMQIVR